MTSPDLPQWSAHENGQAPPTIQFDRPRTIKVPPALSLSPPTHSANFSKRASPSTSLILRNLHREIFKNASDVLPLLEPFGIIQRIQVINPSPATASTDDNHRPAIASIIPAMQMLPSPTTTPTEDAPIPIDHLARLQDSTCDQMRDHMGAVVEFTNPFEMSAALAALHGQVYGGLPIQAECVPGPASALHEEDNASVEGGLSSDDSLVDGNFSSQPNG